MKSNEWLAVDVLEDYLDGKLDAKTMHQVEKLSLEDPFVAEALAGLSLSPKRVQSLSLLQKQLQERVIQKPVEQKRWQITSQRLSIAAAAAVLFVTVSLLFWMRENNSREQLASNTPKKVEVLIAPKVTEKPLVKSATTTIYAQSFKKAVPINKRTVAVAMHTPNDDMRSAQLTQKNEQFKEKGSLVLSGNIASVQSLSDVQKEEIVKNAGSLDLKSKSNADALNEVIIVGYQSRGQSFSTVGSISASGGPQPVGGWDNFQVYLLNNNRLLVDKKLTGKYITVNFELNKRGVPTHVSAFGKLNESKQITETERKEAIRLIKKGPKWILPPNSTTSPQHTNIAVEIKF